MLVFDAWPERCSSCCEVAASSPAGPSRAPWWLTGRFSTSPGVSLPWLTSFAPVCVSIFPTSRAEDLHKLATQFPTLADFDEAVYGNVNTVMGVARPASPALPVPAPASGFGGGERPPSPAVTVRGQGQGWLRRDSSSCSRVPASPPLKLFQVAHTSHCVVPTAAAQSSRLAAIDLADAKKAITGPHLDGHLRPSGLLPAPP